MLRHRTILAGAAMLSLATNLMAASYSTNTVYYAELKASSPHTCSDLVYDPDIFALPNGELRLLAQGANATVDRDSIFGFTRNGSSGAWTSPAPSSHLPAAFEGGYARCGYTPTGTNGPVASPSVVKVGSKYYMAYVGGNADQITGKVYWAVSTDGLNWTHYNVSPPGSEILTPIIYPYYHEECSTPNLASGVGQVYLAYESGYFYFYLRYGHWDDGQFLSVESLAYRISYNSASSWGLGSTRQIWRGPTLGWTSNQGKLVWEYDCIDPQGNYWCDITPPPYPILQQQQGASSFTYYPGDLKYESGLGKWVHFYKTSVPGSGLDWESGYLAQPGSWTYGGAVNTSTLTSAIQSRYGGTVEMYYPGVYFGNLCTGCPTRYLFVPIDPGSACANDFWGTVILSAELVFTP